MEGEWKHLEEPLIAENGGHAMLFQQEGKTFIAYHIPNAPNGAERACIREVYDDGEKLSLSRATAECAFKLVEMQK